MHIDRAAPPYERRDLRSAEQLHERRDTIRGTTRVKTLAAGDIFGEKALLKDDVRTASIVAHSERVLVLTLARDDFTALLGSVAELLSPEVERVGPLVQGVRESPRLAAAPGSVPRGSADSDCHARVCPEDPIQLGQLEVLRTLGRGAFGRVRLARQTTTGVVFALKCQSKAAIVAHRLQVRERESARARARVHARVREREPRARASRNASPR